jgi:hypothetical protein
MNLPLGVKLWRLRGPRGWTKRTLAAKHNKKLFKPGRRTYENKKCSDGEIWLRGQTPFKRKQPGEGRYSNVRPLLIAQSENEPKPRMFLPG